MNTCLTDWWPKQEVPLDEGLLRVLSGLRIGFAILLIYTIVLLGDRMWLLDTIPDSLWAPVSFANLLPDTLPMAFGHILFLIALVSAFLLLVGLFTPVASGVLFASIVLLGSVAYSFGKIDHSGHLLILLLFVLGPSHWGSRWSIDALIRRKRGLAPASPVALWPDWPLRAAIFLVGLLYASAAATKLYVGGFFDPGEMSVFLARLSVRAESLGNPLTEPWSSISAFLIAHPIIGDMLAYFTVVLEASVILGVLSRRVAVLTLGSVAVLHASIWLLAGPGFTNNVLIALLLGVAFFILVLRERSTRISRLFPVSNAHESNSRPLATHKPFLLTVLGTMATLLILARLPLWDWTVPLDPWPRGAVSSILPPLGGVGRNSIYLLLGISLAVWAAVSLLGSLRKIASSPSDDAPTRVLLYDRDCGFCQSWVDWAKGRSPVNIEFAACQSRPDLYRRHDLTQKDCLERAYLVTEDPDASEDRDQEGPEGGAAAILGVLERFPGRRRFLWRIMGASRRLTGIHAVMQTGYCIIARNRHRLGRRSKACTTP